MMSTAKLEAAREFIVDEQYDMARRILMTLGDSPTANKWLAQLDTIAPVAQADEVQVEEAEMTQWEYREVYIRATERVPVNLRDVLEDQAFTTVDHLHTRLLNDYGAEGWELVSEAMEGGDLVRLLFKRQIKR
jgi:hypothetical protein